MAPPNSQFLKTLRVRPLDESEDPMRVANANAVHMEVDNEE